MNGISVDLHDAPSATADQTLEGLKQAIDAIYNPQSDNDVRKNATLYLDRAKSHPNAPSTGFTLASNTSEPATVRHFGLALLEYTVRYRWHDLDHDAADSCRRMVIELAQKVDDNEKVFIRNKIAQLWVDIAKKIWPDEWHDLDSQLLQLWQATFAHQMMALHMLEMLSDDAFAKEEYADGSKGGNVGKACSEIFTPLQAYAALFPNRDQLPYIRAGEEGWFIRLLERLKWSCENLSAGEQPKAAALQILSTLRSTMSWIFLRVAATHSCVESLATCLQAPDTDIQTSALDVLLVLLNRPQYTTEDVTGIVCPLLTRDGLQLLHALYESSQVKVEDLDERKYTLRKKLAEVICAAAAFIVSNPEGVAPSANVPLTIDLIESVLLDPSLVVSIPALYLWTRLLHSPSLMITDQVTSKYQRLLEVCSKRTLRYGNLPQDSRDETFLFLHADFDTMPERHAFVGNYRRYCTEVIEKVVKTSPTEALEHFLSQTIALIDSLPNVPIEDELAYDSSSFNCLRVDAQCTVVASAVKSFCSWHSEQRAKGDDQSASLQQVQASLQQRCTDLLNRKFMDPTIQRRIAQLIGEVVLSVFGEDTNFTLTVFGGFLDKIKVGETRPSPYGETVKDANFSFARLLQKLAMRYSNQFMSYYGELENRVGQFLDTVELDRRLKMDLRAALFLIVHRCTTISDEERITRLRSMMQAVVEPWERPEFRNSVASFESFLQLLNLQDVPEYFLKGNAQAIDDWTTIRLDKQGSAMRETILSRLETMPLHVTKAFLTVSTDRVRHDSKEHQISVALWETSIPVILPTLLPLLSNAHSFGNPQRWESFPPEMQGIVNKILTDRVWQSGISSESRDEFYNRVRNSKETLEGLGSSIRASVRSVRELSYWILHCFAQFGDALYKHHDLAEPLAQALYGNAHVLSSHQVSTLLQISQALIDGCPIPRRSTFLPPLLTNLFNQVDRKLAIDWEQMDRRQSADQDEETLDQQMKAESILRQLSQAAVSLACILLQPTHQGMTRFLLNSHIVIGYSAYHRSCEGTKLPVGSEPLSKTAFQDPGITSSIIIFCTHVLRIKDSRSYTRVITLFRELIPELGRKGSGGTIIIGQSIPPETAAELREFFASEVLKNAISSFHEPYFADHQRDLAWLISQIILYCGAFTETPRQVLLSLPNMPEQKVQEALSAINEARKDRERRDIVLKLLESLRGVSIHEIGKVSVPSSKPKRKTIQEQYMKIDEDTTHIKRGGSPEPGAMTDLFG